MKGFTKNPAAGGAEVVQVLCQLKLSISELYNSIKPALLLCKASILPDTNIPQYRGSAP